MKFSLCQACPYNVIKVQHKPGEWPSFQSCDEYGGVTGSLPYKRMNFLIEDEETEWLFKGETFRQNGNLFAKIYQKEG